MHSKNQPGKARSKRTIFTEAFAYVTELTKGLFTMLAEHKELLLKQYKTAIIRLTV